MSSLGYFKEVSSEWETMSSNFFGEAPKNKIYSYVDWYEVDVMADIGCGAGYLTEDALHHNLKVIAVDQSNEMLDVMKSRFGSKKVSYRQGDSENLPIDSNRVDLVVANMYLHHVDHPDIAIAEMYRILKPKGQLIFTDLDKHDNHFLLTEQHDRWMGFERSDIHKWMEAAGFRNVGSDCVGSNCCAESKYGEDSADIRIFVAKGLK